ncbi:MAG: hypothetical protein ACOCXX_02320 [Planctomycetota bacterium]
MNRHIQTGWTTCTRQLVVLATLLVLIVGQAIGQELLKPETMLAELRRHGATPPARAEAAYRWHAFAWDLEAIGPAAGRVMVKLYDDESLKKEDRRRIILWLPRTRYAGSRKVALEALGTFGDDPVVVTRVMRVLAFAGHTKDITLALDIFEAPGSAESVRVEAARAMAFIARESVVAILQVKRHPAARHAAEFINNHHAEGPMLAQARAACRAEPNPFSLEWIRLQGTLAIPALTRLLDQDNTRIAAARLLSRIDSPLVIPPLQEHLVDTRGTLRTDVARALNRYGAINLVEVQERIARRIIDLSETDPTSPEATARLTELTRLTLRCFGGTQVVGRAAPRDPGQAALAIARVARQYDLWWKDLRRNPPQRPVYDHLVHLMSHRQPLLDPGAEAGRLADYRLRWYVERHLDDSLQSVLKAMADNPREDPLYRKGARRALELTPHLLRPADESD